MALIVSRVALDVLRRAAREKRERAADLRIGYGKVPFAVVGKLAEELEGEADALDKASATLEALQLQ